MHTPLVRSSLLATYILCSSLAQAAPADYTIDPHHTFPSFEADHIGISFWRGKFNESSGSVRLDKATGSGEVAIVINVGSIDFGHDKLNEWARSQDFFDAQKYPQAVYKGKIEGGQANIPARVVGDLTIRDVTHPMVLEITHFKCIEHPMLKRDYCGADARGAFKRDDFGLDAGKPYGFSMEVALRIQVEALKNE